MRSLKFITRFYGSIFLANFLITLSCIWLLGSYGKNAYEIVFVLFWYKLITIPMVFYTAVHYNKSQFYYYQNLGISKLRLALTTSVFDFSLWLALVLLHLIVGIPHYIFNIILWSVLLAHLYQYIRK